MLSISQTLYPEALGVCQGDAIEGTLYTGTLMQHPRSSEDPF